MVDFVLLSVFTVTIVGILSSSVLFSGHYYFPNDTGNKETILKCKTGLPKRHSFSNVKESK